MQFDSTVDGISAPCTLAAVGNSIVASAHGNLPVALIHGQAYTLGSCQLLLTMYGRQKVCLGSDAPMSALQCLRCLLACHGPFLKLVTPAIVVAERACFLFVSLIVSVCLFSSCPVAPDSSSVTASYQEHFSLQRPLDLPPSSLVSRVRPRCWGLPANSVACLRVAPNLSSCLFHGFVPLARLSVFCQCGWP
jgi:hypothetical protein